MLTVWQPLEQRKSYGHKPPMFLVGLRDLGKGRFFPLRFKRTVSKIAQRQGSSPPKPLGVFLLCHAVAVLFAVAMRPTRRLTRKGYRMVGMAFLTRCKSVKPAAGVNLQAGGKWYPIHSMRRSEFFRVKPSLLSYPLGVGGRLGEIIEYLYIRQFMCSKNEKKYT